MKQAFLHIIILLSFINCKNKVKEVTKNQISEIKDSLKSEKLNIAKKIGVVYVTAENGLSYREKPNINSNKKGTFDFGTKLSVIEKTGINLKVKEEEKTIVGEWIKVNIQDFDWKEPYSKQTGYVFSGFTIDSLNADLTQLPIYYGFSQPEEAIVKFNKLDLKFSKIEFSEFNKYVSLRPINKTDSIKTEPIKTVGDNRKGGYFLINVNNKILKFSCGKNYSKPCYIYEGFVNSLNSYSIGYIGDIGDSFLLDKNNNSTLHPAYEFDHGGYGLDISPSKNSLIVYSSIGYENYKDYYDFRSYIVIYDIKDIDYLSDIKNAYVFTSDDWQINRISWINNTSFVLEVFDKTQTDKNGKTILTDMRYFKAKME